MCPQADILHPFSILFQREDPSSRFFSLSPLFTTVPRPVPRDRVAGIESIDDRNPATILFSLWPAWPVKIFMANRVREMGWLVHFPPLLSSFSSFFSPVPFFFFSFLFISSYLAGARGNINSHGLKTGGEKTSREILFRLFQIILAGCHWTLIGCPSGRISMT